MFGLATDEQWQKMKRFIKSDKYKKEDFFVFETMAVGDRVVPDRFQRLTYGALEIMKQDAQKGVSLMLNHNEGQVGVQSIPIGKVFDARIENGTQDGENSALYLTQYILKDDSKVDGYSKNDIVNLIETGIIEDTSVGFSVPYSTATCSVCHNKYFSSDCKHWRGCKYVVNEETGETRTCILEVNAPEASELHVGNNMLIENSVVFDGAYPNAMIQQSTDGDFVETSNGKLKVLNDKDKLEVQSNLIGYASYSDMKLMYKPFEKGGKAMDENKEEVTVDLSKEVEPEVKVEEETVAELAKETPEEVIPEVEQEVEVNEVLTITKEELNETFGELEVTKEAILKFAKEGKEYREKVIEEALKSGVRSMGNNFNKESFRKGFELMETQDILNSKETFEKNVEEKFGTGRVSKTKEVPKNENNFVYKKTVDIESLKTGLY